jgi:oligoribonuclease NrnB/cAMP/cGMP phosphodiesterase (DHH superfamily)
MNVLINHYDLDGVASSIILHQGMKFDKVFKGGYNRFDGFIEKLPSGCNLVIADCAFTVDQYVQAKQKAKRIIFIDHHPESANIEAMYTSDIVVYDGSKAASRLCLDFIGAKKELTKEFKVLGMAANAYDLYERDGQPEWFNLGYDLNILFWEYHYDKFFERFKYGFERFTNEEKTFIKGFKQKRDNDIDESVFIELGEGTKGLVCIPKTTSIMNDIPHRKKGYDVYYIIMQYPGQTSVSIRTTGLDIQPFLRSIKMNQFVKSAGGHPNAAAINFHGVPDHSALVQVIDEVQRNIDSPFDPEDVPF